MKAEAETPISTRSRHAHSDGQGIRGMLAHSPARARLAYALIRYEALHSAASLGTGTAGSGRGTSAGHTAPSGQLSENHCMPASKRDVVKSRP